MPKLSRFILGLMLFVWVQTAAAQDWFPALQVLPALQNARLIDSEEGLVVEKIYPLGSIRRISGRLRYTSEVMLNGKKSYVTLQLARTHEAEEGFAAVREQLQEQGAQMIFWCAGRDCGPSNLWANSVFGNARLYGPDEQQSYAVFQHLEDKSLITVYAVTRGNGRPMLHVEQLVAQQMPTDLRPTSETLLRQLQEGDKLELGYLPAQPEQTWLDLLTSTLKRGSSFRVVIGGEHAALWYEQLIMEGVSANRLELDATQASELYLQLIH